MTNDIGSWQLIIDGVWLLFLFLMLHYFINVRREAIQTKNWVKTKGQVIFWDLIKEDHRLWPKIKYIYEVNEVEYVGKHFFPDTMHNNPVSKYARRLAYKAAMSFEKNQQIDVYYDPIYPQHAALDIRMPWKVNLVLVLLIALIIFHLLMVSYRLFF
jgi:hypothetical protein